MKNLPFNCDRKEGTHFIMDTAELDVQEIRFNHVTREIFVVYDNSDIADLPWRELKKRVLEAGGTYKNKEKAIEFLSGG